MGEKTITNWATDQLGDKLTGLHLADGLATQSLAGGWVSGEVSISERKGKSFPIYSLEVEVPFEGTIGGQAVKGTARLPDVSLEMLEDLEVVFTADGGGDVSALETSGGAEAIRAAVREWASGMRKAVSEDVSAVPLDPPAQARTPRAAALISDQEAMSAGGAAELDDADEDVEDVPHPDDAEGGEEDEPFTEEEVGKMYEEAKAMLHELIDEAEYEDQLKELNGELDGRDLQERGRILIDVISYLESNEGEEGEEGAADGGGAGAEPFPGGEGLEKLWQEVLEICAEDDVPRLEEELKGKAPQEQWKILLEVRDFLINGDADEQQAFNEWQPTVAELDGEWKALMDRVPPEEAEELAPDFAKASAEDKKRMVWDARNFLDEQDEEEAPDDESQPKGGGSRAPPPRPPTDAELGESRGEMRRRGGASKGRDYEARMECGFDGDERSRDKGDWDEYYDKEVRRGKKGGSMLMYGGVCLLLSTLELVLTATALADQEETVFESAMRLVHLA